MPDQDLHSDYPELMSSYLSGNATDAEVQQLEAWVLEDPEHRQQFMAFKKAWMLSGMVGDQNPVDVEAQWQVAAAQLFKESKAVKLKPRARSYRWLSIAAAATLVAAISIWALLQWSGERELYVATTDQVQSVELPDGSMITLNRASSLRYTPVAANSETAQAAQRQVILEGDAFFEVQRDPARPFIIRNNDLEIEVLGTSFYVDGRENQPELQVIVESGSVAVRTTPGDSLILTVGQKAIYEKAVDSLYRQPNEDPNFQSIKTKTITFDDSTLEEIAFALSRHYGVAIVYSGIEDSSNCILDGDYEDYSLEEILAFLRSTWGIEAVRNGDRVVLSGTVCQ